MIADYSASQLGTPNEDGSIPYLPLVLAVSYPTRTMYLFGWARTVIMSARRENHEITMGAALSGYTEGTTTHRTEIEWAGTYRMVDHYPARADWLREREVTRAGRPNLPELAMPE